MKSKPLYNARPPSYRGGLKIGHIRFLSFEEVQEQVLDLMPAKGESAFVLDIGAGSGRDAAWFARNGCEVVAVEPSGKMIEAARQLHGESTITWIQDRLPSLEKTIRSGLSFDLILASAVWVLVAVSLQLPDDGTEALVPKRSIVPRHVARVGDCPAASLY